MLRLVEERKRRGFSQLKMSRKARMAPSDVSRIESGRFRPYRGQLRRLARAIGWPVADAQRLLDVAETVETPAATRFEESKGPEA